jgi:hypothetical protein
MSMMSITSINEMEDFFGYLLGGPNDKALLILSNHKSIHQYLCTVNILQPLFCVDASAV